MIEEGYLDNHEGCWVEDEEDGAEGFLETDNDIFWFFDERTTHGSRFKGRKGKGKGCEGSGGRRFFKKRKGRSSFAGDQADARQAEGQWPDSQWQDPSWDDWSWDAAKGKGKKDKKGQGRGEFGMDGKDGKPGSKHGAAQLADAQSSAGEAHETADEYLPLGGP